MRILEAAANAIEPLIPVMSLEEIRTLLELPPRPEMGDVALPCFTLAKTLRKAPVSIVAELADLLNASDGIGSAEGIRAEALGPYLNL